MLKFASHYAHFYIIACSVKPNFSSAMHWNEIKKKLRKSFKASNISHLGKETNENSSRDSEKWHKWGFFVIIACCVVLSSF